MRCPVCNSEFQPETTTAMPFCSPRCRSIDLGRWFDESYTLPAVPNIEADEKPEDDWAQERSSGTEGEAL
ncbi:MAG: DNA gyrase inhibitor YacG [Planctomycetales bacterium]|nr:DNA gyrase inhibitor YacG [Planctomycetales bacterium]